MAVASSAPATTAAQQCRNHRATPSGVPLRYASRARFVLGGQFAVPCLHDDERLRIQTALDQGEPDRDPGHDA